MLTDCGNWTKDKTRARLRRTRLPFIRILAQAGNLQPTRTALQVRTAGVVTVGVRTCLQLVSRRFAQAAPLAVSVNMSPQNGRVTDSETSQDVRRRWTATGAEAKTYWRTAR